MIPNTQKSKAFTSKGPLKDPILDDFNDFMDLDQALSRLGLQEVDRLRIFGLVAAVLHLGECSFF
jgi:myosin VI